MFFSKILFIDTEQFSKTHIFSHVFFKEFVDGFGATSLKMNSFEDVFRKFCW